MNEMQCMQTGQAFNTHKRKEEKKTMKKSKSEYLHTKKDRSMMQVSLFLSTTLKFYHFFNRSTLSFWLLSGTMLLS